MTRKHLNPLAKDLGWKLSRILRMPEGEPRWMADQTFWDTVDIMIRGMQAENPRIDRDRFIGAIMEEAERIASEPVVLITA
jgi:hypothetical protein